MAVNSTTEILTPSGSSVGNKLAGALPRLPALAGDTRDSAGARLVRRYSCAVDIAT